ncbi:MAG: hypothetical protein OXE95_13830 [Chloroflexi bacterium]|nr:hypothetical protein [Chloroflexota bacterium]MCY4248645.1 hypothetical protein [Chloroflexota bacterium]
MLAIHLHAIAGKLFALYNVQIACYSLREKIVEDKRVVILIVLGITIVVIASQTVSSGPVGFLAGAVGVVWDFISNLHIMLLVAALYLSVGFLLRKKEGASAVMTIGALIAFWVSTIAGIVTGSVIGLLTIAVLLRWNSVVPRLLSKIQAVLTQLKARFNQERPRNADR